MDTSLYDSIFIIGKQAHTLAEWKKNTLLIVNTATQCALASQFSGLQKLHDRYHQQGLVIIGFPCSQFHQEPENDANMVQVCQINHGVTFALANKIEVNGKQAHPLFQCLKKQAPVLFGSEKIKWNFTKFLIAPQGIVITRYAPSTKPELLEQAIKKLLFT